MSQRSQRSHSALEAWLSPAGADGVQYDARIIAAAVDVIDTVTERPAGTKGALYRFGHTAGTDGWPLNQVSEWMSQLADCVDRRRRSSLVHYSAHASVVQGWADGYVRGASGDVCFEPTTGLATEMVLRLRLQEAFAQSHADGVDITEAFALILVDLVIDQPASRGLSGLAVDLRIAAVAEATASVFCRGETVARVGDRIVVLAPNTPATLDRASMLSDVLWLDATTSSAHTTVMIDEPPLTPELLDGYLRDLVA